MCNSNKGTGGMEISVVLCIHLFACTLPSVSISLVCNDWLAYKHRLHPVFQTRLECGSLSAHTHQSPALCVSSTVFQTRLDYGPCLGTSISLLFPWSNSFGSWFLVVYMHQFPLVSQTRRIKVPCLRAQISPGSLSVHTHQTRLIMVACLSTLPPAPARGTNLFNLIQKWLRVAMFTWVIPCKCLAFWSWEW